MLQKYSDYLERSLTNPEKYYETRRENLVNGT
ncbi:hypothetical protein predicted by Glimmer/Critica [Bdellovibrio bacteriovorus HD100]|uniref:Uncharacterized protein n=1 Tax=Bdellovibrio bacteriovorus (strain ATCC 15356 / DSM 50701 / NCIMB 9529 / HD100) TaxID=264462 RepID=Q6MIJ3_BDEBA|nr:hypothetical protein predicted by Glimmer/Critica [Bdellovibrio bacteriovorus HD100]